MDSKDHQAFVNSTTKDILSIWFNQHTEEGEKLAELAIASAQARAKETKVVDRKKTFQGPALPGKLSDCNSTDLNETELFFVEGDSAIALYSFFLSVLLFLVGRMLASNNTEIWGLGEGI